MSSDKILKEAETSMEEVLSYGEQALKRIRAGRVSPDMVSQLRVDYYGSATPLMQIAAISNPDARSLQIKPWEKDLIPEIERAIQQSDLGVVPQNNGETVILNTPPLSEERRKQVLKQAKQEAEKCRVRVRNTRKEINEVLKKDSTLNEDETKQACEKVQKLTDKYIEKTNELLSAKEKEIMRI